MKIQISVDGLIEIGDSAFQVDLWLREQSSECVAGDQGYSNVIRAKEEEFLPKRMLPKIKVKAFMLFTSQLSLYFNLSE